MKKPIPAPVPEVLFPPSMTHVYFDDAAKHPFEPQVRTYSPTNAWWCAEAALLAYGNQSFVPLRFKRGGLRCDDRQPFSGASTQAYVAHNDAFVLVAFRGTQLLRYDPDRTLIDVIEDVLRDIYADAKFGLVVWDGARHVHRGFKAALDEIWEPLAEHLNMLRRQKPERPVWFTGHSLGAALATLAADRYPNTQGLYTFGSPLVGDSLFRERFTVPAFRIVNHHDIIARVPLAGPVKQAHLELGVYHHVGQLVYIDAMRDVLPPSEDSDSRRDALIGKIAEALDIRTKLRRDVGFDLPSEHFTDHAPLYYVLHLWNALQN